MFKRPPPSPAHGALAERVRRLGARPAPPIEAYAPKTNGNRAERTAVFRNATIEFESGERMQVAVKNVSATGARVEHPLRNELPATFLLIEPTLKLRKRVRVAWQREGVAGVRFLED